jgi:RNA polymerase sigma-70 factor (ECF subfamily)
MGMTPEPARDGGEPRRHLSLERERGLRERLATGDERALAELIDVMAPWLLGIAGRMLGDPLEAEDIVQEVFVRLWRQDRGVLATEGHLVPWLLRATRTRSIDRLRTRARHSRLEPMLHDPDAAAAAPVEPNEAATPGWHVHRTVHGALGDLPPEQRAVLQLSYFEGLTQSEVAERLAIPLGTVKTRSRRALARLREVLGPMKEWLA